MTLRGLIYKKGITQRELARLTGISEVAISRYVKGDRTPIGSNFIKLAQALDVSAEYLYEVMYEELSESKAVNAYRTHILSSDTLQEKGYKYCPYCGKEIELDEVD